MKTFTMHRGRDETGVSGTGNVLQGTIYDSGRVVLEWLSIPSSIAIYNNFEEFLDIHVKSHPNNETSIVFDDGHVVHYGDSE